MKKFIQGLLILTLGIALFSACTKEKNSETPPELPPESSMKIDFSSFGTQKSAAGAVPYSATTDTSSSVNFAYAGINVAFWSTIITGTLVVPVAAFSNSFTHDPVFLGNATWQWSYNYNSFGGAYSARLTGTVGGDNVKWEMYISKTGINSFSELKWFEGTSKLDGTGGEWLLYYSVDHPDPFLQINWTRSGDSITYAKYTIVRDKKDDGTVNPVKGSYIEAGHQDGDYDAFYNIHLYDELTYHDFVDVSIEWSTTAYYGHVMSQPFFQDADWHCWDSNGKNMDCTN